MSMLSNIAASVRTQGALSIQGRYAEHGSPTQTATHRTPPQCAYSAGHHHARRLRRQNNTCLTCLRRSLLRHSKRRQMRRHTIQRAALALFFLLQRVPGRLLFSRGTGRLKNPRPSLEQSGWRERSFCTRPSTTCTISVPAGSPQQYREWNTTCSSIVTQLFAQQRHIRLTTGFYGLNNPRRFPPPGSG